MRFAVPSRHEELARHAALRGDFRDVRFGSEADAGPSLVEVRFGEVSGTVRGLQTKLQTNHATQHGTGRYMLGLSEEK